MFFSVVILICLFIFYFYFFYTRKLHVAPQSRTGCSLWNALQVIFVLFTVGTMISMMWFTIILKTSLESMKKRVTSCKLLIPSSSLHEYKSSSNVSSWRIMVAASLHFQKCLKQLAYFALDICVWLFTLFGLCLCHLSQDRNHNSQWNY